MAANGKLVSDADLLLQTTLNYPQFERLGDYYMRQSSLPATVARAGGLLLYAMTGRGDEARSIRLADILLPCPLPCISEPPSCVHLTSVSLVRVADHTAMQSLLHTCSHGASTAISQPLSCWPARGKVQGVTRLLSAMQLHLSAT